MKYNVYLLNFNNYYNRRVLTGYNTVLGYINAGYQVGTTVLNCNFEYKDGINSEITVNQSYVSSGTKLAEPDYLIVAERDSSGNETGSFSRWFILDSDLVRGNQYHMTLKRDICVDYNNYLMESTYFVERGWANPDTDLIFNSENQAYSQVKTNQTPLYDETKGPWIVGYIPRNAGKLDGTSKTVTTTAFSTADMEVNGIANWEYYQYVGSNPSHTYLIGSNQVTTSPIRWLVELPVTVLYNNIRGNYILDMPFNLLNKTHWTTPTTTENKNYVWPNTVFDSQSVSDGIIMRAFESDKNTDTYWYNQICTTYNYGIKIQSIAQQTIFPAFGTIRNRIESNMSTYSTAYNNLVNAVKAQVNIDDNAVNNLIANISGHTIKDTSTGKIYTVSINQNYTSVDVEPTSGSIYTLANDLLYGISSIQVTSGGTVYAQASLDAGSLATRTKYLSSFRVYICTYTINLTEAQQVHATIPANNSRQHLYDAPYDMFCIPYSGALFIKNVDLNIYPNIGAGLAIATEMSNLFTEEIYDLQILPYCPCRDYIVYNQALTSYEFNLTQAGQISASYGNALVTPILNSSNTAINYIIWCRQSNQPNFILQNLNDNNVIQRYSIEVPSNERTLKESCELDMYRLCSPNYASIFEFNAAKNRGVEYFECCFNYKPFNPYIKIRPHFNALYGINARDARGLILQGDFSVPMLTNTWAEYERQNKNYLNSFNREIESLEVSQDVERVEQKWKVGTSTVKGAAAGATAGAIAGSVVPVIGTGIGAAAGAVVGGATSLATGIIDWVNGERLRNDALDKAKDLFNYNIENIKAISSTIRNVGCLTYDNLMVPILEYYTAPDVEVQTFRLKMKYYGNTINRLEEGLLNVTEPNNETFVQGYLLRLGTNINITDEADNHLAMELSSEISKGLYITRS